MPVLFSACNRRTHIANRHNRFMHQLRTSFWLSRLILAWFALTLGAASASPFIHPQAMELICTTSGEMRWVNVSSAVGNSVSDDTSADSSLGEDTQSTAHSGQHNTLDCALCLPAAGPAPLHFGDLPPMAQPLSHALRPLVAAHIASVTRAPLPARGPPAHS